MDAAEIKSLNRALLILRRERQTDPRLDIRPPAPEDVEGARAVLRRMDGLQMYQALIEQPQLAGQIFSS